MREEGRGEGSPTRRRRGVSEPVSGGRVSESAQERSKVPTLLGIGR